MCVLAEAGCPNLTHPTGMLFYNEPRTTITLQCHPNFELAGTQIAYCDGREWDRMLGNCREVQIGPATWCDFEAGMCGWSLDPTHDYDWQRKNGVPPSGHMPGSARRTGTVLWRTGPQHDHTTGVPLEGYYMLAQMANQAPEDVARLVSPLYAAEQSANACFRMFYHMYGAMVGHLRVKMRSVGADAKTVLLFETDGDNKNEWLEALVGLPAVDSEFQLVIEAYAGISKFSDIGVDDLSLLSGDACASARRSDAIVQAAVTEEVGGVYEVASCEGRCGQARIANYSADTMIKDIPGGGVYLTCDCTDCLADSTCCLDYIALCENEGKCLKV